MQVLELLANGNPVNTNGVDMLAECASVMGYIECANDMLNFDVVSESVVLEGLDIKGFFKKIMEFFRGIFSKLLGMIKSFWNFLTRKGKKKEDDDEELDAEDVDTEEAKNVFERNPYTGVNPKALARVATMSANITTHTSNNAIKYLHNAVNGCYTLLKFGGNVSAEERADHEERAKKELEYFSEKFEDSKLAARLVGVGASQDGDYSLGDWLRSAGIVPKSVEALKNLPTDILNVHRAGEGKLEDYKDYTNYVFKGVGDFNSFVRDKNAAQVSFKDKHTNFSKDVEQQQKVIKEQIDRCDFLIKNIDKLPGDTSEEELRKKTAAINKIRNVMVQSSQGVTNLDAGFVAFSNAADAEFAKMGQYIKKIIPDIPGEVGKEVVDAAKDMGGMAVNAAKDAAKNKLSPYADAAKEKIEPVANAAKEKVAPAVNAAQTAKKNASPIVNAAREMAKDKARSAMSSGQKLAKDQMHKAEAAFQRGKGSSGNSSKVSSAKDKLRNVLGGFNVGGRG